MLSITLSIPVPNISEEVWMKHVVGAFIEMSAVVIPRPNKIKQKAELNITALVQNIQLLVL